MYFADFISVFILYFIRLDLLGTNNVLEEKSLYSEVNNIAIVADTLINRILVNLLLFI
jgi:hypothetical protein